MPYKYRPTPVDPYRDHLRRRRAKDPSVPITRLLAELKELGYTSSANLLVRYLNQGRVDADHATLSPHRVTPLLVSHPENLREVQRVLRDQLAGSCQEMTVPADQIRDFAILQKRSTPTKIVEEPFFLQSPPRSRASSAADFPISRTIPYWAVTGRCVIDRSLSMRPVCRTSTL
ncbi:hypothetical protein [Streptomyces sp. NPDC127084]|uniref:hypothetical protein n=1 Tax=Streptomyces sp. NPDC127084 TaxID=3347133 RepID=UPI003664D843